LQQARPDGTTTSASVRGELYSEEAILISHAAPSRFTPLLPRIPGGHLGQLRPSALWWAAGRRLRFDDAG
jgi:hypothetical protein